MTNYVMDQESLCCVIESLYTADATPFTGTTEIPIPSTFGDDFAIFPTVGPNPTCTIDFTQGGGIKISQVTFAAIDTIRIKADKCSKCFALLSRSTDELGDLIASLGVTGSVAPTNIQFCLTGKCCCCC